MQESGNCSCGKQYGKMLCQTEAGRRGRRSTCSADREACCSGDRMLLATQSPTAPSLAAASPVSLPATDLAGPGSYAEPSLDAPLLAPSKHASGQMGEWWVAGQGRGGTRSVGSSEATGTIATFTDSKKKYSC